MSILLTPTIAVSIESASKARLTIGNVGMGSVNIEIERSESGGAFALAETIGGSGTVIWEDYSLGDGTAYLWRVRVRNDLGEYSAYSSEEGGATTLPAAEGLWITGAPTSAVLHWTRRAQNNTGVKIWRTNEGGSTFYLIYTGTTPGEVEYSDSGPLLPAQNYKYYVETYNAIAAAASAEAAIFTDDPPNAPSLPTLIALLTTALRAGWQDNADNELGFTVEWGTDGSTFPGSATVGPNITTYDITGLPSNTLHYVRIKATNASGSSAYTSVVSCSTLAAVAQPGLAVTPWGSGRIECVLRDCSELETDHRLERRQHYVSELMVDVGLENWLSATNLTSWTESVSGTSTVNEESSELRPGTAGSRSCRMDVDASNSLVSFRTATLTLVAGERYCLSFWYKCSAPSVSCNFRIYDSGSHVFLLSTGEWALSNSYIDLPNATDWTNFTIFFNAHASYTGYRFYFKNNAAASSSLYFDDISLLGPGAYAEIATIEPNREFYPNTGLTAGSVFEYRARARQSGSPDVYSAYSDSVLATVLSAPDAPTALAVSKYQDKQVWLTWVKSAGGGEAGYEIYKALSGGAFSLYRTVGPGIESCRVSGLAASTAYDFKVRAINAAGNSAYTSTVSQTTRAAYLRSDFEKLQLQTKPADWLDLVEINPTLTLSGWALVSGKTFTYQRVLSEPVGVRIVAVSENGEDLDVQTSIANVESNPGSFYFDYAAQTVYVHASGSDDPINYYYLGSFWMHCCTGDTRAVGIRQPVVFNGDHYLPLVPEDGIPDVTLTIEPHYKGDYKPARGSVSLINGISKAWGGVGFFDKLYTRYNWKGRKAIALAGRVGWAYSQFEPFSAGVITGKDIDDRRITFSLRDYRETLNRDLPKYDYWESEFANLDPNARGKVRPKHWGAVVGFAPSCIDTVNRVFELNYGRISDTATVNVYQGGVALTGGTDYFVDYQRGWITLARGLAYASTDVITADFTAGIDGMGLAIEIGPPMLLDLLREEMGLALADIDHDAFYDAAETATTALVLSVTRSRSFDSCVELIEKSCLGWMSQDNRGRLTFRLQQTAAPSGVLYIQNARIKDGFSASDGEDNTFAGVDVGYAESFDGTFQTVRIPSNTAKWRDGVQKMLPLDTLIPTLAGASALGAAVVGILNKPTYGFDVDRCLYTAMPGDPVYFSRSRYFSDSGVAALVLGRILTITKSRSSGSSAGTFQEI